jgi:hypothetical protein
MIDCLHLEILQCSCSCGQRWTHSYPLAASRDKGLLGGTPNPQMLQKLQHESYTIHYRNFNGCFRCVSLQLSEGWTKPLPEGSFPVQAAPSGPSKPPPAANLEDLLS